MRMLAYVPGDEAADTDITCHMELHPCFWSIPDLNDIVGMLALTDCLRTDCSFMKHHSNCITRHGLCNILLLFHHPLIQLAKPSLEGTAPRSCLLLHRLSLVIWLAKLLVINCVNFTRLRSHIVRRCKWWEKPLMSEIWWRLGASGCLWLARCWCRRHLNGFV